MQNHEIIGREREIKKLESLLASNKPEFLAVYGRRRIGKTYLIRKFFQDKGTYFEVSGTHGASKQEQLRRFKIALKTTFPNEYSFKEWDEAFDALHQAIRSTDPSKKCIIFLDELPWFASPKSGFLSSLDHFWNLYLSKIPNIILIICGSAAHWMIKKVIRNKGGLHNRLTEKIQLEPFTLQETEKYLEFQGVDLSKKQVAELYMAFGGVANYLDKIPQGQSSAQIIGKKCFDPQSFLFDEFKNLYESLFDDSRKHISIIRALSKKPRGGMTLPQLLKATNMSSGGSSSSVLEELEEAGFIISQLAYGKRLKETTYRLIDEYSLFYLRWIEPLSRRSVDSLYWTKQQGTPAWFEWAGHAFENLCLKHTHAIKHKLGISGIITSESYFSHYPSTSQEKGAEIDLVIDRSDACINLCELKFTNALFTIDKNYFLNLENKKNVFREQTRSKKALFTTLITTYGVTKNIHSSSITEIVLEDLFIAKS